jgi:monolysocardiolipin acyltransferase
LNSELREGDEARKLRMEVAFAVREEILKLRRARGWADEDPKARFLDTYREEGGKREGKMDDDSWVKDT